MRESRPRDAGTCSTDSAGPRTTPTSTLVVTVDPVVTRTRTVAGMSFPVHATPGTRITYLDEGDLLEGVVWDRAPQGGSPGFWCSEAPGFWFWVTPLEGGSAVRVRLRHNRFARDIGPFVIRTMSGLVWSSREELARRFGIEETP